MKNRRWFALTAGALYILFALICAVTFVAWLRTYPNAVIASLKSLPGAFALGIAVSSLIVGVALVAMERIPRPLLVVSLLVAAAGASASIVVGPFWLLTAPFVLFGYRRHHDD